jgi:hypothetical protein
MSSSAYPTVFAALVTTATTALGDTIRVVDGFDLSSDAGDVMVFGVPNLTDSNAISAGSFTQTTQGFGRTGVRQEAGTISGYVMAWNGDGDQTTARTTAFGYLSTLGDALRLDPKMGVTAFDVAAQVSAGDVLEDQAEGATTAISFTVAYQALI